MSKVYYTATGVLCLNFSEPEEVLFIEAWHSVKGRIDITEFWANDIEQIYFKQAKGINAPAIIGLNKELRRIGREPLRFKDTGGNKYTDIRGIDRARLRDNLLEDMDDPILREQKLKEAQMAFDMLPGDIISLDSNLKGGIKFEPAARVRVLPPTTVPLLQSGRAPATSSADHLFGDPRSPRSGTSSVSNEDLLARILELEQKVENLSREIATMKGQQLYQPRVANQDADNQHRSPMAQSDQPDIQAWPHIDC